MASKGTTKDKSNKPAAKPPMKIGSIFKTDIGFYDCMELEGWAEYNQDIIKNVMKYRIDDPDGLYRSNLAGTWHSNDDLLNRPGMERLRDTLSAQFRAYTSSWGVKPGAKLKMKLQSWAMMYTDRGYATIHTHPNCHLSAVYFCDDSPTEEKTMATGVNIVPGELEFFDTRANIQLQVPGVNSLRPFRFRPKAGMILVFPSWLPHFVHPVSGEEPRISIATNMTIMEHIKEEP